jgi:hypothetical protein
MSAFTRTVLDWHQILYGGKIDEKVNRFITIVNSMVEKYFPESTIRRHSKDKPFITNKIKSLIVKRNTAYSSGKIELFRLLRDKSQIYFLRQEGETKSNWLFEIMVETN